MADDNEDRIGDQAIGWFALLRDEQVTAADRTAFERWLAADPRHAAAWREVELLWSGLDGLAGDVPPAAGSDNSYIDYPSRHAVPEMSLARATGVAMIGGNEALAAHQSAQEVTGIGEMRTIELPDGSSIELDTASALSIHFTDTARRVVLHDGQGSFMVAKHAAAMAAGSLSFQAACREVTACRAFASAFSRCSGPSWIPSAEMNSSLVTPMKPKTPRR